MSRILHPFLVSVLSLCASMAGSLIKLLGMQPRDGDFASQRQVTQAGLANTMRVSRG
jgi:hypothetical protein